MVEEKQIQGGKAIFYGSEKEQPCGVQLIGKDDLGNEGAIDFEVYACSDLGIRRVGTSTNWMFTLARFDTEEVANTLIEGFKKCGCPTKIKE